MLAGVRLTAVARREVAQLGTEDPAFRAKREAAAEARGVDLPEWSDVQKMRARRARGVAARTHLGKNRMRGVLGFFQVFGELIRLRVAEDVTSMVHEVGHALEKIMFGKWRHTGWEGRLRGHVRARKELRDGGKRVYPIEPEKMGSDASWEQEGFAEFLREYLSEPELLAEHYPNFNEWFQTEFLRAYPAVRAELEHIRELFTGWRKGGSINRVAAQIKPAPNKLEKGGIALRRIFSIRTLYEFGENLRQLTLAVEAAEGVKMAPEDDPYFVFQATRLTHTPIVTTMIRDGMLDVHGNRIAGPLLAIAPLVEGHMIEFQVFLFGQRSVALYEDPRGARQPGISYQDAQNVVEELGQQFPKFSLAAQKLYDWQGGALQYAASASSTFAQIVRAIEARDPGKYIPLQRVYDEIDSIWASRPTGGGGVPASAAAHIVGRLKGNTRRIKAPIEQIISQTEQLIMRAHERMVIETIIKIGDIEKMGSWVTEVERPIRPIMERPVRDILSAIQHQIEGSAGVELTYQGVPVTMEEFSDLRSKINAKNPKPGEEPTDEELEKFEQLAELLGKAVTFFAPIERPANGRPIFPVYTDGMVKWYEMDGDLYATLKGMDRYVLASDVPVISHFLQVVAWSTRTMRLGTTGLRAAFALVTNPLRDFNTLWAYTHSSANPFEIFVAWLDTMRQGAMHALTGKGGGPWIQLYNDIGGFMATPLGQDAPSAVRLAEEVMGGKRFLTPSRIPGALYDVFVRVLGFPELAARATELRLMSKEYGWTPGMELDQRMKLKFLLRGKQVTVDFTASGQAGRVINQVVPFFNTNLQGHRAFVRAARHNPWAFSIKMTHLTLATLALWWLIKDEEWWLDMPLRQRSLYWYIPAKLVGGDDDTIIRIPRAFEVGALGAAIPEAFADAAYRKDPESVAGLLSHLLAVTTPDIEPVIINEMLDQAMNRDRFWDRPIVPMNLQRNFLEEQYDEYTSRASVLIGRIFGWSPKRIDHAFQGQFGGAGMDALRLPDFLFGAGPKVVREREPADIPVAGTLFLRGGRSGRSSRAVQRVWDAYEEATKIQRSERMKETPAQRRYRLVLSNATQAIGRLTWARAHVADRDRQAELSHEIREIAQDALSGELSAAKARSLQRRAARQKERIERSLH